MGRFRCPECKGANILVNHDGHEECGARFTVPQPHPKPTDSPARKAVRRAWEENGPYMFSHCHHCGVVFDDPMIDALIDGTYRQKYGPGGVKLDTNS